MADQYTVRRAFCRPEPSGVKTYEVGMPVIFDTPEQATYYVDAEFVAPGAPAAPADAPVADKPAARVSRGRKPMAVTAPDPDADVDDDAPDDDDE